MLFICHRAVFSVISSVSSHFVCLLRSFIYFIWVYSFWIISIFSIIFCPCSKSCRVFILNFYTIRRHYLSLICSAQQMKVQYILIRKLFVILFHLSTLLLYLLLLYLHHLHHLHHLGWQPRKKFNFIPFKIPFHTGMEWSFSHSLS